MKTPFRHAALASLLALALGTTALADAPPEAEHPPGWLGILLGSPDDAQPKQGSDATEAGANPRGVIVRGVVEDSPAERARVRAKDLIVAVDGAAMGSPQELMARLRGIEPGSSVTLSVRRGSRDLELEARVGARPASGDRLKMIAGWLGVEAIDLPPSLREHFGAPADAGIMVSRVVEGSPAEDAGMRVGDVVYEADGRPVTSSDGLSRVVTEAGVDNALEVALSRDGARIVVEPHVARLPEKAQAGRSR